MLEHLRDAEMEEDEGDASPQSFDVTAAERSTPKWTDVRIPTRRFRIRIGSDGNKSNISRIYNIFAFHSFPIKSQFEISLPLSDYIQRVHGLNCLM